MLWILRALWPGLLFAPAALAGAASASCAALAIVAHRHVEDPVRARLNASSFAIFALVIAVVGSLLLFVGYGALTLYELAQINAAAD